MKPKPMFVILPKRIPTGGILKFIEDNPCSETPTEEQLSDFKVFREYLLKQKENE
jgi:hypothetical protein